MWRGFTASDQGQWWALVMKTMNFRVLEEGGTLRDTLGDLSSQQTLRSECIHKVYTVYRWRIVYELFLIKEMLISAPSDMLL
jgi:hypothetical protein